MKIEMLTTHVDADRFLTRAESEKLADFGCLLTNSDCFCGWEAILWSWNALSGPKDFTSDHFMKIEWLVTMNCGSDPRKYTWYCHRIPGNCPDLPFVSQNLLRVAVNCPYRTPAPPRMFTNGVWIWLILLWGSLHTIGTLEASFGTRNMNFKLRSMWSSILAFLVRDAFWLHGPRPQNNLIDLANQANGVSG